VIPIGFGSVLLDEPRARTGSTPWGSSSNTPIDVRSRCCDAGIPDAAFFYFFMRCPLDKFDQRTRWLTCSSVASSSLIAVIALRPCHLPLSYRNSAHPSPTLPTVTIGCTRSNTTAGAFLPEKMATTFASSRAAVRSGARVFRSSVPRSDSSAFEMRGSTASSYTSMRTDSRGLSAYFHAFERRRRVGSTIRFGIFRGTAAEASWTDHFLNGRSASPPP
jgi:hypothetical protein